ncbi:hypothetical protein WJX77_004549 [Trebouxia sp. C0004]
MSRADESNVFTQQVITSLQRLNGPRLSPKQCLSQCDVVRFNMHKSKEALYAFSTHRGVHVLLQQMTQTFISTDLLDSILCCLICSLQQDQASSQAIQAEFWASQGEVSITEAVGFVLAGQADAAAINDSLTDYLKLLALLGRYNTPEQQLQLLRVSQGVLKQAAQIMQDSAGFQAQLLQMMQQLLQIDDVYHIDGLEVLKGSKLLRTSARAVKNHSQDADVFQHAVALLNMLLTDYRSSSCFDALVEEVLDSNFALEVEIAVRDAQDQQLVQQGGSKPSQVQLDAAIRALKQLGGWQAQHRDHMRTDVMQAMEESSDDESIVADGSQINMAANASSFGSLPVPDKYGSGRDADQDLQKVPTQHGQTKAHRSRGLVSLIKDALRRH